MGAVARRGAQGARRCGRGRRSRVGAAAPYCDGAVRPSVGRQWCESTGTQGKCAGAVLSSSRSVTEGQERARPRWQGGRRRAWHGFPGSAVGKCGWRMQLAELGSIRSFALGKRWSTSCQRGVASAAAAACSREALISAVRRADLARACDGVESPDEVGSHTAEGTARRPSLGNASAAAYDFTKRSSCSADGSSALGLVLGLGLRLAAPGRPLVTK